MTIAPKTRWLVAVAAMTSAAALLAGCGGSTDSTSPAQPVQASNPQHVVPSRQSSGGSSENRSATGHKRASKQPKLHSHSRQGSPRAAKPRSGRVVPPAPPTKPSEDAVAKVKELIAGSGGGKQRTASTPKEIREVLQEIEGQPGNDTSGSPESGGSGSGSPSSVEEVLETLGGG